MRVGDIVRMLPMKNGRMHLGIIVDEVVDDKLCVGEPISFYRIMWSSGLIGDYNEYFCETAKEFEVISESR